MSETRPSLDAIESAMSAIRDYQYDRRDPDGKGVTPLTYSDAREFVDDAMPDLLAYVKSLEAEREQMREYFGAIDNGWYLMSYDAMREVLAAPTSPVDAPQPTAVAEDAQAQLDDVYWADEGALD